MKECCTSTYATYSVATHLSKAELKAVITFLIYQIHTSPIALALHFTVPLHLHRFCGDTPVERPEDEVCMLFNSAKTNS